MKADLDAVYLMWRVPMTKSCLVTIVTSTGHCVAELHINSLHQLALLMPASVISYEVYDNGESSLGAVSDSELYDLLLGLIKGIGTPESPR